MIQVNSRKCISANKYLLIYIDSSFIPQMLILANLFWNLKKIVKFRNRQRKLVYSVYINHSENRMHHYNIRCVCVGVGRYLRSGEYTTSGECFLLRLFKINVTSVLYKFPYKSDNRMNWKYRAFPMFVPYIIINIDVKFENKT